MAEDFTGIAESRPESPTLLTPDCDTCRFSYHIKAEKCLPSSLRSRDGLVSIAHVLHEIAGFTDMEALRDLQILDHGCCIDAFYRDTPTKQVSVQINLCQEARSAIVTIHAGHAVDSMQLLQAVHSQYQPKRISIQGGRKCNDWTHYGEQVSMRLDSDWSSR